MSATEDRKKLEEAAEIGWRLHTALRKACDSTESAYLWNVVHLLSTTWDRFCVAVAEAGVTSGEQLLAVAENEEAWWPRSDEAGGEPLYARTIFRIALEEFDEWDGFVSYLEGAQ